jgi:hypothetical protein
MGSELTSIHILLYCLLDRTLHRIFRALQVEHTALVACAVRIHGALEGVGFPAEDIVAVLGEAGAAEFSW